MIERFELRGGAFRQEYPAVVSDYFRLTPYTGRSDLFDQQTAIQQFESPVAEAQYNLVKDFAWKLARQQGKYPEAVQVMRTNLKTIQQEGFSPHDEKAIKIFFLRRLGRIYEHWATYGEKEKPFSDASKKSYFLMATYYYMLGDIEMGIMTEFASRIAECLRGMDEFEAGKQFDMVFWGQNIHYISAINIELEAIKKRGKRESSEESAGVSVENWFISLPDSSFN